MLGTLINSKLFTIITKLFVHVLLLCAPKIFHLLYSSHFHIPNHAPVRVCSITFILSPFCQT